MYKYRLLKDLPDHEVGQVETYKHWIKWFKDHNFSNQIEPLNCKWFELVTPLFYTHEGEAVYHDTLYYSVFIKDDIAYLHKDVFNSLYIDKSIEQLKNFSIIQNANTYYNKLIEDIREKKLVEQAHAILRTITKDSKIEDVIPKGYELNLLNEPSDHSIEIFLIKTNKED